MHAGRSTVDPGNNQTQRFSHEVLSEIAQISNRNYSWFLYITRCILQIVEKRVKRSYCSIKILQMPCIYISFQKGLHTAKCQLKPYANVFFGNYGHITTVQRHGATCASIQTASFSGKAVRMSARRSQTTF